MELSSLAVQRLGLGTFTTAAWGQSLGWELRSPIKPLQAVGKETRTKPKKQHHVEAELTEAQEATPG